MRGACECGTVLPIAEGYKGLLAFKKHSQLMGLCMGRLLRVKALFLVAFGIENPTHAV